MSERDLARFRDILLSRRREIFDRLRNFESDWRNLDEREIELEEQSQKLDITSLYDKLSDLETEQIETIDLAFYRMAMGDYGICESCRKPIPIKRLEAIPEARQCLSCSKLYEEKQKRLSRAREQIRRGILPVEFRDFSDEELRETILEQLRNDGRIDVNELSITFKNAVLYLEGVVPSETEHQIILRVIRDIMGFTSVIDYLDTDEVIWERRKFSSGRADFQPSVDVDSIAEDVFESQDEESPYMFPDRPPPEEE